MRQHAAALVEDVYIACLTKVHFPHQVPEDAHIQPRGYHTTARARYGYDHIRSFVGRDLDGPPVRFAVVSNTEPIGLADCKQACQHRCIAVRAAHDHTLLVYPHYLLQCSCVVAQEHTFDRSGQLRIFTVFQFANGTDRLACTTQKHGQRPGRRHRHFCVALTPGCHLVVVYESCQCRRGNDKTGEVDDPQCPEQNLFQAAATGQAVHAAQVLPGLRNAPTFLHGVSACFHSLRQ